MKRIVLAAAAALALLPLTGCGASGEARNEVQSAIVRELIPSGIVTSAADGDEAALEFVDNMHTLAEQLTADIVDDDVCDSASYATGLGDPTLVAAHEQGCAVAAEHGIG